MDFHSFDNPEDFMRFVAGQQDRAEMAGQDQVSEVMEFRHSLYSIFDKLDADELDVMHTLFLNMVLSGKQAAILTAQFWCAWTMAVRQRKFNVCPACFKDHSEADAELAAEAARLKEELGGSE